MHQRDQELTNAEPAKKEPSSSSPRRALVILLAILAVAAVLRVRGLAKPPTLDELWSLELSTGRGSLQLKLPGNEIFPAPAMTELKDAPPAKAIWSSLDRVAHPPLYFLVLREWRAMFGGEDVVARWLSLAASLAAIVVLYDAARRLTGSQAVALWSAALLAVAEPQIDQARLVRGYTLLLLFGVLAWWAVIRLRETQTDVRPTWRTFVFAGMLCAASLALLLTHYFAVGAVAALLLFTLMGFHGVTRRYGVFAVFAAGCFFMALWGTNLARHFQQFSHHDSTTEFLHRTSESWTRLFETASDLGASPLRLLVDFPPETKPLFWLAGSGCIAMLFAAFRRRRPGMLLVTLWLLGTLGFVFVLDLVRSTTQLREARYLLLASPALYVLLAMSAAGTFRGLTRKQMLLKHAIPAILVLACLARDAGPQPPPEMDWRPIAKFLDEPSRAEQPIVYFHGQPDWFLGHILMAYRHASTLPPGREMVVLQPDVPKRIISRLARDGHAWAICLPEQAPWIERMLPGWSVTPVDVPDAPRWIWELRPPGTL
jgi:uncharacterized membrane protein